MPDLLLSCQDLKKSFGHTLLFEGLSFGVFEGDHIGIVGPNGSGKSTLLKILAGDESPSAGTCAFRQRLRRGYVPQEPRFPDEATVASAIGEGVTRLGLDRSEEHTSELQSRPHLVCRLLLEKKKKK